MRVDFLFAFYRYNLVLCSRLDLKINNNLCSINHATLRVTNLEVAIINILKTILRSDGFWKVLRELTSL